MFLFHKEMCLSHSDKYWRKLGTQANTATIYEPQNTKSGAKDRVRHSTHYLCREIAQLAIIALGVSTALYAQHTHDTYGQKAVRLSVRSDHVLVQSFMGIGVELEPYAYPPTPEEWVRIVARLDELHPSFFRVMISARLYCRRLVADGCGDYIWRDTGEKKPEEYEQLLRILNYAQAHNIVVDFGEFHWPSLPHDASVAPIEGPDDPRWAEIIAPFFSYLVNEKHYSVLRFYNYQNEPNGAWSWHGERVNYDAWLKGITHARQVFDHAGLQSISIVGPDNTADAWNWLDRAAHDAAPTFGAWEMHFYPKDEEIMGGEVFRLLQEKRQALLEEDPGADSKPFFLGECGLLTGKVSGDLQPRVRTGLYGVLMTDLAVQVAQAGWMGASAWDLDDAMHKMKGSNGGFKVWGFWNIKGASMGAPDEERVRPWFMPWALLGHLLPRGAQVLEVTNPASTSGVRAIASKWTEDSKTSWGIILVNDHDQNIRIDLNLPRMTHQSAWMLYKYLSQAKLASYENVSGHSQAFSKESRSLDLTIPPWSVFFVTNNKVF